MTRMDEINQESEQKLMRARDLVDALRDEDVNVAEFKAVSSILDALETMFNTLSRPIVVDPTMFMGSPQGSTKKPKKEEELEPPVKAEDRIQSIQDKQYL